MAFTEFYVQPTGSNLNAGSTTANAAAFTYTSKVVASGWNAATGVFTVASGDPAADGVAVGDFASIYVTAGATVATFVARVTARDATTITVSLTAVSGTPPATDGTGATTCKIGGAWAGPSAAVAFPFNFVATAMTNASGDTPRVNIKSGTTYSITAAMTHTLAGPVRFQGYTSSVGDGGRAIIDGGTAGASYVLLTVSGANIDVVDITAQNNGATGAAAGIAVSGGESVFSRVVVNSVRGYGFNISAGGLFSECEAYSCNQSNTASVSGFNASTTCVLMRCISHDNSGSNSSGFTTSGGGAIVLDGCIADTNGAAGFNLGSTFINVFRGCEAYNNTSDGAILSAGSAALYAIENCNFVKNGGWGINGSGAGVRNGIVRNCGFGSGTQANASGTTTGLKSINESGTVIYAADVTPWSAPTTGDFRIALAAAKGTGRGTFTQTQASYTGTVGYPDIGAAQHVDAGGGGGGALVRHIGMGIG